MQLEALEFVEGQECAMEEADIAMGEGESRKRCDKAREEVDGCEVCMVGKAKEQFTEEGLDHMEWDVRKEQFIKTQALMCARRGW